MLAAREKSEASEMVVRRLASRGRQDRRKRRQVFCRGVVEDRIVARSDERGQS